MTGGRRFGAQGEDANSDESLFPRGKKRGRKYPLFRRGKGELRAVFGEPCGCSRAH